MCEAFGRIRQCSQQAPCSLIHHSHPCPPSLPLHTLHSQATNPRWLAPEVMRGERATKAADVFAFGVVM